MGFVEKGRGNPTSYICELLIHMKNREHFCSPAKDSAGVGLKNKLGSHGIFKLKNVWQTMVFLERFLVQNAS